MARDWFGRKTNTDNLITLDSYYEKPSALRLWSRRILGILIIALLLFAFVWAALWVYRSLTNNSEEDKPATQSETKDNSSSKDNNTSSSEANKKASDSSAGSTTTTSSSSSSSSTNSSASGNNQNTNTSQSAGSGSSNLPHTGDDPTDIPTTTTDVLPSTGG